MNGLTFVVVFLLFTYPAGIVIGLIFWSLWLVGVLEIRGLENFPRWRTRLLVVFNHPSLLDPILIIGLSFWQYLWRPFKYGPKTVVDPKTYFKGWKRVFYLVLWPGLIAVDREDAKGGSRILVATKSRLEHGAIVLICPEGGRTLSLDRGRKKRNEEDAPDKATSRHLVSLSGRLLRRLKGGISFLATGKGVLTLPIWVEWNGWSRVILVIGEPVSYESTLPEEVVERVQNALLKLADLAG